VLHLGYSWQSALGLVFIAGILFFLVTVTSLRKWVIEAIPESLVFAITAGLGLFIALIALNSAGIVVADPGTMVALGKIGSITGLLFLVGFCSIVALEHFKIPGAMIIGILATAAVGVLLKISPFHGIFSMPPSMASTFTAIDLKSTFQHEGFAIIFTFFLISFFDSTGTLVGLLHQTKLKDNPAAMKRLSRGLLVDSIATVFGAFLGTSTTTPFIESASGMRAGGKTGLTAVIVGLLFLCALFLSPLAKTIPAYATAPALLFVATLMIKHAIEINWQDLTESIPSVITIIMIPFTYSIACGVGLGIISYVLIKIFCGKIKELNITIFVLALIFLAYLIFNSPV
jgi:AGZA family xanthine/uracil permease-like MFS transporter